MARRHPGIENLLGHLEPDLPNLSMLEGEVAGLVHIAALEIVEKIPTDNAELTAGLRKLLEAQDCLRRAAIDAERATG